MPPRGKRSALGRHPWHAAAIATMLAVLVLLLPMGDRVHLGPLTHVAHVLIFAVLVLLWMRALTHEWLSPARAVLVCLVLGAVLAIGTEWMQQWIPGRWPGVADVGRNLLGLAVGLGAFAWRRQGGAWSR